MSLFIYLFISSSLGLCCVCIMVSLVEYAGQKFLISEKLKGRSN